MCSDCMLVPPCEFEGVRIHCDACNRHFRSRSCSDNHRRKRDKDKKTVCERKRCCATCVGLVTRENHECKKRYCENYNQNKDVGHLCYMRRLNDESPPSDGVLNVFYDFETTQNTRYSDGGATLHIPKLVCLQQFCLRCEDEEDAERDC